MRAVSKVNKKYKQEALSLEKRLERDLRDCMKCRFFWGNDSRCIRSKCLKEEKLVVKKEKTECDECPYKKSESYCFPCMKKILGQEKY